MHWTRECGQVRFYIRDKNCWDPISILVRLGAQTPVKFSIPGNVLQGLGMDRVLVGEGCVSAKTHASSINMSLRLGVLKEFVE